jgi:hypothetical protein
MGVFVLTEEEAFPEHPETFYKIAGFSVLRL